MQGQTRIPIDTNNTALQHELDKLEREHRELKARLSELNSRLCLSQDEEVERKTIQKLKLLKKDKIALMTSRLNGRN